MQLNSELVLVFLIVVIFAGLLPQLFYLATLQNTLKLISPHNRKMNPGQVWLILIPLYGIFWHFMVVGMIADSLNAEFDERKIRNLEMRPGASLGNWALILGLLCVVPYIKIIAAIPALVCWICYWVKIAGYKRQLEQAPPFTEYSGNQNPFSHEN
jgi:hypothetical protein